MLSSNARKLNFFLKYFIKPPQVFLPINPGVMRGLRKITQAGGKLINKVPGPVMVQKISAGGVPGEWLIYGDDRDQDKVILYFHGGGYFFCSPDTHRPITWRLARETGARVLSLDYRLVPEHTMADCREDAVSAFVWLLEQGYAPENIVIGGDSAGGGLTLLTLLALKSRSLPQPRAAFCLSPFADMSRTSPTFSTNIRQSHMFHRNSLQKMEAYLSAGKDPYDPEISPAFGDYSGLPPLFIQAADSELLLNDALLAAKSARRAGLQVELKIWHNLPHVFPIFADIIPEGKQGIREVADFVNKHFVKLERAA
ncbi:MAG: alpha/beta hydrolase [Desulfosudaceae bacterium]